MSSYTFIRFFKKFLPILLIGPVRLFGTVEYTYTYTGSHLSKVVIVAQTMRPISLDCLNIELKRKNMPKINSKN